jgi:hypothetical protein
MPRAAARGVVAILSSLVVLVVAEAGLRWLDGYRLLSFELRPSRPEPAFAPAPEPLDERYVDTLLTAPGVQRTWYRLEPHRAAVLQRDKQLLERAERYPSDPIAASHVFNRRFLEQAACGLNGQPLPAFDDFLYFDPPGGAQYPTYRLLPHVNPAGLLVTNNFGWRGHDVALNRPARVIRIAFVGASTTIDAYGVPFSHPELIEWWLNKWAADSGRPYSFDVINAGRSGVDSRSIAAIVRDELLPLDPDLVVFYEGANQFWPGQLMKARFGRLFPKPSQSFRRRVAAEMYSALVRRTLNLVDRAAWGGGREPLKPPYLVEWPASVDEHDPNAFAPDLPMDLTAVVSDLERMRTALSAQGGELAVASFIWLVRDGMRLDLARHLSIYRYLNDTYWPVSYALMRRVADFQNRVFEKYARGRHLAYFDIAGEFPQDPDLFDDAIHLKYEGLRLQAWMFVQALIPVIVSHADAGTWPRPARAALAVHPAFAQSGRRLVTAAELKARCS